MAKSSPSIDGQELRERLVHLLAHAFHQDPKGLIEAVKKVAAYVETGK